MSKPISKPVAARPASRGEPVRGRVLAAAERLLRVGDAAFSMRDLAAEAGVSFATPFNQFGSKAAIMQALSTLRIDAMAERFRSAEPGGDAADRVFAAVDIAVAVMMAEPAVNRAVMGNLGSMSDDPGQVHARSRALWVEALGAGIGVAPELADLARSALPDQLAVAFRGVLSFWAAGEIGDAALASRARAAAAALLLGFVDAGRRDAVLARAGWAR